MFLNPSGLFSRRERAALSAGKGTRHRSQRPPQAEAGFLLGDTAEVKANFTPSRTQLAKTQCKTKGMRKKPPWPCSQHRGMSYQQRNSAQGHFGGCKRASVHQTEAGLLCLQWLPVNFIFFLFIFSPGNAHKTSSRSSTELWIRRTERSGALQQQGESSTAKHPRQGARELNPNSPIPPGTHLPGKAGDGGSAAAGAKSLLIPCQAPAGCLMSIAHVSFKSRCSPKGDASQGSFKSQILLQPCPSKQAPPSAKEPSPIIALACFLTAPGYWSRSPRAIILRGRRIKRSNLE